MGACFGISQLFRPSQETGWGGNGGILATTFTLKETVITREVPELFNLQSSPFGKLIKMLKISDKYFICIRRIIKSLRFISV